MKSRRLWVMAVLVAILLDVVLCGAGAFSFHHFTWVLLLQSVAVRIAGALIVGAITGWLLSRMGRSLFAACFGLLVSDLVWMRIVTSMGTPGASDLLLNPLIVIVLLICPIAASADRRWVFRVGLSIAIVVPLIVAAWILYQLQMTAGPGVGGTGLAQALTIMLTFGSIVAGVGGILVSRYTIQAVESYMGRLSQASDQPAGGGSRCPRDRLK